jgi:hypothetical protein
MLPGRIISTRSYATGNIIQYTTKAQNLENMIEYIYYI